MSYDNFDEWRNQFRDILIQCGMPEPQARRYYNEFADEALDYFDRGVSPADAATSELMG